MADLPTDVKHTLANFDAKISELEALLAPFLKEEKNLFPRLDAMDTAKLNLTVSYAITTLFSLYLKTQGASPEEHPVSKELDRIKQHLEKLKSATGEGNGQSEEPKGSKSSLNTAAAARMIEHGTGASSKKRKTPEDGESSDEESPKKTKAKDSKKSKR